MLWPEKPVLVISPAASARVASSISIPVMLISRLWGLGCSVPVHCFLDEEKAKQDPSYYLKNTNAETRETLQELYKEFKGDEILAATMKAPEKKKVDQLNAVSGLLWLCFFPRRQGCTWRYGWDPLSIVGPSRAVEVTGLQTNRKGATCSWG